MPIPCKYHRAKGENYVHRISLLLQAFWVMDEIRAHYWAMHIMQSVFSSASPQLRHAVRGVGRRCWAKNALHYGDHSVTGSAREWACSVRRCSIALCSEQLTITKCPWVSWIGHSRPNRHPASVDPKQPPGRSAFELLNYLFTLGLTLSRRCHDLCLYRSIGNEVMHAGQLEGSKASRAAHSI